MWGAPRSGWLLVLGALSLIATIGYALLSPALPFVGPFLIPLIPLVVFASLFLYKFDLPNGWPQEVRAEALIERFRYAGYNASMSDRGVKVDLGDMTAVSFPVDRNGMARGRYRIDATRSGYGALTFLFLIFPFSPFVIPISVYISLRARGFVLTLPLSTVDGKAAESKKNPVSNVIASTLWDLYQLNEEAYKGAREDYHDNIALTGIISILAWLPLIVIFYLLLGGGSIGSFQLALIFSAIASVALLISLFSWLRRSRLPPIMRLKAWNERLKRNWYSAPPENAGHEASNFEIMMEAMTNIPEWLEISRRSVFRRHPVVSTVVVGMWIIAAGMLLSSFYPLFLGDRVIGITLLALSILLTAISIVIYRWQLREDRKEVEKLKADFQARLDAVKRRMEQSIWEL